MPHRHVFKLITDESGCPVCHYAVIVAIAKCECGEQIGPTFIESALAAVECLSAENAIKASGHLLLGKQRDSLCAYARALSDD